MGFCPFPSCPIYLTVIERLQVVIEKAITPKAMFFHILLAEAGPTGNQSRNPENLNQSFQWETWKPNYHQIKVLKIYWFKSLCNFWCASSMCYKCCRFGAGSSCETVVLFSIDWQQRRRLISMRTLPHAFDNVHSKAGKHLTRTHEAIPSTPTFLGHDEMLSVKMVP